MSGSRFLSGRTPNIGAIRLTVTENAGATFHPATGAFHWIAKDVPVPSTNTIVYSVTDNGAPTLSDSRTCKVVVLAAPRVVEIHRAGSNVQLIWTAIAGVRYRVQFKYRLSDEVWTGLSGEVTASGTTATKTDVVNASQRFYQIEVVP